MIANYSYPAIEGAIAVFSCSNSGYMLTGPSTVTCMGNGEWVPDPRDVQCEGSIGPALIQCLYVCILCIAIDCGRPLINVNVNATYNSTLFNARLALTCGDSLLPSGVPTAQCYSNGNWTPNPADFTCKSVSEPESGTKQFSL